MILTIHNSIKGFEESNFFFALHVLDIFLNCQDDKVSWFHFLLRQCEQENITVCISEDRDHWFNFELTDHQYMLLQLKYAGTAVGDLDE